MKTTNRRSRKVKVFESLFILILCMMIVAAVLMVHHVKVEIESNGIESAETAVRKAENLLTSGILSDKSAVTRFGDYIQWDDKEDAVKTMNSFIKEYDFSYAIFLGPNGQGYDQDGKPQSAESLPFQTTDTEEGELGFVPFYKDKEDTYMTAITYAMAENGKEKGTFYVGVQVEKYSISARLEAYVEQGVTYILDTSNMSMIGSTLNWEQNDIEETDLDQFLRDFNLSDETAEIDKNMKQTESFYLEAKKDGSYHFYMPVEGYHGWYLCGCIPSDVISHESDNVLSLIKAIIILAMILSILIITGAIYILYRRRKAERNQAEKNELENAVFDALSEKSDSVLCIFDLERHQLEKVFRNSKRILGRDSEEYIQNPQLLKEICDLASPLLYERIMERRIDADESWQLQLVHAVTGETRVIRFTIKSDIVIAGKKKYMFYWEDITQNVRVQESLRLAAHTAEQANRSKSKFLSNMSHEIRTPMNAILGMIEIMERNLQNPLKIKDSISKIKISTLHLLNIINDILDLSRIESGKITLNNQSFYLSDLIDNVVNIIRVQADGKDHGFEIYIHKLWNDTLIGDWTRLNQILINILSNSVKYTKDGGRITLEITENPGQKDGYANLTFLIKDNGIGMSKDFIERHLGNPFEQEQTEEHIKEGGTGLGLSIVYNIVKMMKGTITIESEVGLGTEVAIHLDLKIDDSAPQTWMELLKGMRILLADGDAVVCEDAASVLGAADITVDWAEDGNTALALLKRGFAEGRSYQAVIADWNLPELDGVNLMKEIEQRLGSDSPLTFISAYDWAEIMEGDQLDDAKHFIKKPLFPRRLYAALESAGTDGSLVEEHSGRTRGTKGWRLLLVEDNDLNREIAAEFLTMGDMEFDTAVNGQIAVDHFLASAPGTYDAILMDLQMPVKDGLTATREIRASNHEQAETIPIIAMTANAFEEDVKRCFNAGMNAHLAKPLDLKRMLGTIEDVVRKNRDGSRKYEKE
ncbi:response regulator [Emergencia timonensis]|uniref:hybrid sensor histidine kinase/response regulator n=1 Tax=Emergencia timonensis TaxID=1776384 RepID=UPI00399534AE